MQEAEDKEPPDPELADGGDGSGGCVVGHVVCPPVLGTGAQGTRLALRVALTPPPELRKGWGSNHAGNPHAPGGIPVAGGLPPVGSYPLRVVAIELTDATPSGTRNHISPTCNPDTRGSHRADRCDT